MRGPGLTVAEALAVLGLERPSIKAASDADAEERLAAWKAGPLRRAWAAAAKVAHPDRGGSDADMARVNAARDCLDALKVQLQRPRRAPDPVHATGGLTAAELDAVFRELRRARMREVLRGTATASAGSAWVGADGEPEVEVIVMERDGVFRAYRRR